MESRWSPMESRWSPVGSKWSPGGVHSSIPKTCTWTILHVDSTWSPVEFMWSHGVHVDSMGEGKVHIVGGSYQSVVHLHRFLCFAKVGNHLLLRVLKSDYY